jgi:predicted anti-sigma-YlaC factor YlaD
MSCNEIREKLVFLNAGDLTSEEEKQIFTHLDNCDGCRSLSEKLTASWMIMENEKINYNDVVFVNRIMQRIEAQELKHKNKISSPSIRILRPVAVSLLSAAAIFTGIILGEKFSVQFTSPEDQRYLEIEAFANEYFLDELEEENIETILFTQNTE